MIPDTYTTINEDDAKKLQKMLDLLDDDDDIQEVYHNAEFPEGWEEQSASAQINKGLADLKQVCKV